MEGANGVGSTTNTGDDGVRESSILFLELRLDLPSNNTLEVANNGWEWMGANRRSNEVVRISNVRDPVTHGFVDSILECPLTILHRDDLCAKSIHAENIQLLSFAVNSSHVNDALQSKHGTNSSGSHTVLSSSCLSNDTRFSEAFGEKGLANSVINLVSTSVGQILALQPDSSTTGQFSEAAGLVKRGRSADEVPSVSVQFCHKIGVVFDRGVSLFDLFKGD
mmetsp:Transcript_126736/g.354854  ORF Transcript_126736/g.354854 Transcript_126736/m.354854 type:complete len:222 (-) Transcript_126736:1269-1934(-)